MILVAGATGTLGSTVTRMLLAQGWPVRILARPHSRYQALSDLGAQVVFGDLKEPDTLDAACEGVDIVITTASGGERGGEDTVQAVDWKGSCHLIEAAKGAGVKQFIFVSVAFADVKSQVPIWQAKGQTEEALRESGLSYTIIAPDGFMDMLIPLVVGMPALTDQPVTLVGEGRRKHSFITISDVAAFIRASIGNPAALNQRLLLGGPEPISLRDAVAVYERVLERPIPVRSVAPGEPVPGIPQIVAGAMAGLETFDSPIDMTRMTRTFDIRLTSLEEMVRHSVAGKERS
ncbi:MAG: SDR family oxidoreductase [Ktedonobacteraceae bacterium]|nr:SDR family oxidoreductase [Ktedonobacteraceae bacterium]